MRFRGILKGFTLFFFVSFNSNKIVMQSHNDCNNSIQSASVILSAIFFCSLEAHIIVQHAYIIVYPVCGFLVLIYLGAVGLCHILQKLSFINTSKLLLFLGSKVSPSLLVTSRVLTKFFTVAPWGFIGSLDSSAHWWVAYTISRREIFLRKLIRLVYPWYWKCLSNCRSAAFCQRHFLVRAGFFLVSAFIRRLTLLVIFCII